MSITQPNQTLYVKNIDWKIKKGILRRALYSLFTRHGKVLEVVALRKDGLRGQAFVIMEDVQAATAAMQNEQGFTFFGKDLVIEYAKKPSARTARNSGDYIPKAKRPKTATTEPLPPEVKPAEEVIPPPPEEKKVESAPPSRMLLAQNLPPECNEMMLGMLFQQYAGYKEVRIPRAGLAFIEFEDEPQATVAKNGLQGFKLTANDNLGLVYGKV